MSPAITVHRPRGLRLRPQVAVKRQALIDYQPSWLLLLIPAITVALIARRKRSEPQATDAELAGELEALSEQSSQRWRRPRLRRGPVTPTTLPEFEADPGLGGPVGRPADGSPRAV